MMQPGRSGSYGEWPTGLPGCGYTPTNQMRLREAAGVLPVYSLLRKYNDIDALCLARQPLIDQDFPPEEFEILVVDNGCNETETSCAIVDEVIENNRGYKIQYIAEPVPGLFPVITVVHRKRKALCRFLSMMISRQILIGWTLLGMPFRTLPCTSLAANVCQNLKRHRFPGLNKSGSVPPMEKPAVTIAS